MSEDIQVPTSVLTLRDLAAMCDAFIKKGANPDNPVLVYSDPEGNSLNTLCNNVTLAKLDFENQWLPTARDIPVVTEEAAEHVMSLSDTHIVIGAFQEFSWDESQYESVWDQPVDVEVV